MNGRRKIIRGELNAITCPKCGGTIRRVTDSRPVEFEGAVAIGRRRECASCSERTTTVEFPLDSFNEIKRSLIKSVLIKMMETL